MSLYYYNEEEDKKKEGEESIDKYTYLFKDYKKNPPSLDEALKEMYINTGSTEDEAEGLKKDIISKCKNIYKDKKKNILETYPFVSEEEANIISSYTCESKKKQNVHTKFLIKIKYHKIEEREYLKFQNIFIYLLNH